MLIISLISSACQIMLPFIYTLFHQIFWMRFVEVQLNLINFGIIKSDFLKKKKKT